MTSNMISKYKIIIWENCVDNFSMNNQQKRPQVIEENKVFFYEHHKNDYSDSSCIVAFTSNNYIDLYLNQSTYAGFLFPGEKISQKDFYDKITLTLIHHYGHSSMMIYRDYIESIIKHRVIDYDK